MSTSSSSSNALQIVSSNITNIDTNCKPIIVELKWNTNNQYDATSIIPQCGYQSIPSWSNPAESEENEISINKECIPLYHDHESVKCGCNQFGTYSTLSAMSYSSHTRQ